MYTWIVALQGTYKYGFRKVAWKLEKKFGLLLTTLYLKHEEKKTVFSEKIYLRML